MIYLDSAATTKIDPQVLEAMMPYLKDEFGNAGTLHALGRKASAAIDKARQQVAELINCAPDQVIFTSGGTEGNNLVLNGLVEHLRATGKTHIIVSSVEHNSVLKTADSLIKQGFYVTKAPVDRCGRVDPEVIEELIGPDTGLVSVMMVNNEIGTINPVKRICDVCHSRDVLFHTDCVQAASVCEIDVQNIECDFLTISSHKIHGPKGVGMIYAKNKDIITPVLFGGSSQEYGLRGGTENVPGIVGFGKACEYLKKDFESFRIMDWFVFAKKKFLCDLFRFAESYGYGGTIAVNGDSLEESGKILSLRFENIDAETLLLALSASGVYVSVGSACDSQNASTSHVLRAIGLSDDEARQSIRISFDKSNSIDDITGAAIVFSNCIASLQKEVAANGG